MVKLYFKHTHIQNCQEASPSPNSVHNVKVLVKKNMLDFLQSPLNVHSACHHKIKPWCENS